MILPNKYLRISESFIGLSALFLDILKSDKLTIETLWNKFNKKYINKNKIKNKISYQKYIHVETVKNFVYGNPPSKGKINLRRRVLKCQGKDKKQIEQK